MTNFKTWRGLLNSSALIYPDDTFVLAEGSDANLHLPPDRRKEDVSVQDTTEVERVDISNRYVAWVQGGGYVFDSYTGDVRQFDDGGSTISVNDNYLSISSSDVTTVRDVETGEVLFNKDHTDLAGNVECSSMNDDKLVIGHSDDVEVYDIPTASLDTSFLVTSNNRVPDVEINSQYVAVASDFGDEAYLHDASDGTRLETVGLSDNSVTVGLNSGYMVAGGESAELKVMDTSDGSVVFDRGVDFNAPDVTTVAINENLLINNIGGEMQIRNVTDYSIIDTFSTPNPDDGAIL